MPNVVKRHIWNKFLVGFLNGIVILLPAVVTIALVRFLFLQVNNIVLNPLMGFFAPMVSGLQQVYIAKTVIFLVVIFSLAMIGWGAKVLFINRVFSLGERMLIKLPIMGRVYNAAKQISSAFIGHGKTIFKQVVLIEYPRKGLYSIGFTTGTTKGELKEILGTACVNVFVPTTPNPTSGIFLIVPHDSIKFLRMSVEEGMKLAVSGGAVIPQYKFKKQEGADGGAKC